MPPALDYTGTVINSALLHLPHHMERAPSTLYQTTLPSIASFGLACVRTTQSEVPLSLSMLEPELQCSDEAKVIKLLLFEYDKEYI